MSRNASCSHSTGALRISDILAVFASSSSCHDKSHRHHFSQLQLVRLTFHGLQRAVDSAHFYAVSSRCLSQHAVPSCQQTRADELTHVPSRASTCLVSMFWLPYRFKFENVAINMIIQSLPHSKRSESIRNMSPLMVLGKQSLSAGRSVDKVRSFHTQNVNVVSTML